MSQRGVTATGGRAATTRHIPPKHALAVGMPTTPAPKGWRWVALTEIARMESGHTPSRRHPEYWDGDIPWISIQDAKAHHGGRIKDTIEHTNALGIANSSARVLPKNTVCLSRTASVGYVVVTEREMATSQDFVNWICSEELEPDFLKYLLLAEGDDLLRFASGAVHQTIYFPEAKAFHICHPSVAEQRRIVRILDTALASASAANDFVERNVANVSALFESYLRSVLAPHGDEWMNTSVGAVTRFIDYRGKTPKKTTTGVRLITAKNVKMGFIQETPREFIAPDSYEEWMTRGIPNRGDVLFTTEAPLGNVAQLDTDEKVAFAQRIIIMQPNQAVIDSTLLKYVLLSEPVQRRLRAKATGATVQGIKASLLKSIEISFPKSLPEQRRICAKLDLLAGERESLDNLYARKREATAALKASLLHHAFTGQL